ncbi:MAG: DNA recombination protein RmuC, partial [Oscillospiraceae bacterium]|nr:DNA recombination protein RmuC [Oscillospiraceae bacterium]
SERVEFAIRIPAGDGGADAYLPVDSKFPMEDYVRLCSAADSADAEEVAKARKALEDRVLSEAKLVTKYINVPATTPFAIMYLATEGLYAEIASSRTGIAERIQREYNIMIAGPTTITALLNSLSMGFRAVAINEKANEVRRLLSVAKAQYEKFGDVLDKAKKKIDEAGRTLVAAQDRNRIMAGKLKGIESMDAAEADAYLGIAEQTDGSED